MNDNFGTTMRIAILMTKAVNSGAPFVPQISNTRKDEAVAWLGTVYMNGDTNRNRESEA